MNETEKIAHQQYLKKLKLKKLQILLIQIAILAGFLLAWELAARYRLIDTFLFSCPSAIADIFLVYLSSGQIWQHIGITLWETLVGFAIGSIAGIFIAILLWWSETLSKIFDPFLVVLNALPKTALAPIVIVWFGAGMSGIIAVAVSISIIVTIMSAYTYFINIDADKIKMLRSFGATKLQLLTKLVLPANVANLVSIAKINIGLCLIGVIVGEFLVSRYGIGYLIVYGSQVFRLDLVMMGVVILAICAWLMNGIINVLEHHIKKY